jgi:hypothetical protein
MSEQEEQTPTQTPTLRGSDNEKAIDLSGAIPFMIDISNTNITNITEIATDDGMEIEDDDFYGGFFSGGTVMTPDYPSKEQLQAEEDVRAVLFKDMRSEDKSFFTFGYPKKDAFNTMLNSPMFQNNDGFTAMNDYGLSVQTMIDTSEGATLYKSSEEFPIGNEPKENFGIAAANDEAETTVDDFFPAPFIPFTM